MTSDRTQLVGSFLRARRERVTPSDVGLPAHGRRRTPGLRREEVAMLAGISADYYLRLERAKDAHPSVQVLEALARVLRLDDVERAHLMAIACEAPRPVRRPVEDVPDSVLALLGAIGQPAFVEDRFFDVHASNGLARALSPTFAPGANQLRGLFLDPDEQARHPDWRSITECWVACLRQAAGADVDDPQLVALLADLDHSERFRELWARHDVRVQDSGRVLMAHPEVGELTLLRDRLAVSGSDELHVVVLHPEPGSVSAARLASLAGGLAVPRLDGALAAR